MRAYIRSASCISAQKTFGEGAFLTHPVAYHTNRLKAIEPEYRPYIDPKMLRRMSRVIRMGVAAAKDCLQHAGVDMPDAIITGTAYGCLEDTGIFLSRMIGQQEEALSPTAFIQSTHNTVGAQIALLLQCHQYNNTFVHKGFSFESALLDSLMLLNEGEARQVLVGAADELTDQSFAILNRFNRYKAEPVNNLELYQSQTPGSIAGEGTAFFLLNAESCGSDLAVLDDLETLYKPAGAPAIIEKINHFLQRNQLQSEDIDLVLTGKNGDAQSNALSDEWTKGIFPDERLANYKHLSGEYPTASAFALWLAANIIKKQVIPPAIGGGVADRAVKRILIANQYQQKYYALMLVSALN